MIINCPIEGYEDLSVTIPDTFLVRHHELWAKGVRESLDIFGNDASIGMQRFLGCVALCEKIENPPDGGAADWPLDIFHWLIDEVYHSAFEKALNPKKKILSKPPVMLKAS